MANRNFGFFKNGVLFSMLMITAVIFLNFYDYQRATAIINSNSNQKRDTGEKSSKMNNHFTTGQLLEKRNFLIKNNKPNAMKSHRVNLEEHFTGGIPQNLQKLLIQMYSEVLVWDRSQRPAKILQSEENLLRCENGYFRLPRMSQCKKVLSCPSINDIVVNNSDAFGTGKIVSFNLMFRLFCYFTRVEFSS